MRTDEITNILQKRCRGIFLGVFPLDRLPSRLPAKRPLLLVCNTHPHFKPGEHWVVLYIGKDSRGEYFDSFGTKPCLTFERYLNKYCNHYVNNNRQIQSVLSQFCGHYCIFYCLFRSIDYDINDVVKCFTLDTTLNDFMVHNFVCKLL